MTLPVATISRCTLFWSNWGLLRPRDTLSICLSLGNGHFPSVCRRTEPPGGAVTLLAKLATSLPSRSIHVLALRAMVHILAQAFRHLPPSLTEVAHRCTALGADVSFVIAALLSDNGVRLCLSSAPRCLRTICATTHWHSSCLHLDIIKIIVVRHQPHNLRWDPILEQQLCRFRSHSPCPPDDMRDALAPSRSV